MSKLVHNTSDIRILQDYFVSQMDVNINAQNVMMEAHLQFKKDKKNKASVFRTMKVWFGHRLCQFTVIANLGGNQDKMGIATEILQLTRAKYVCNGMKVSISQNDWTCTKKWYKNKLIKAEEHAWVGNDHYYLNGIHCMVMNAKLMKATCEFTVSLKHINVVDYVPAPTPSRKFWNYQYGNTAFKDMFHCNDDCKNTMYYNGAKEPKNNGIKQSNVKPVASDQRTLTQMWK